MLCKECLLQSKVKTNKKNLNTTHSTCLCCNKALMPTNTPKLFCEECSEERWICEQCGTTFRLLDLLSQEELKEIYLSPSLGKQEEKKVIAFLFEVKKQRSNQHEQSSY